MSIRCSVLGHDTDEVREEVKSDDGEVSVVKVVEECVHCGQTETIKEKKRVSIAEAEAEYNSDLGPQAATASEPAIADGGQRDNTQSPNNDTSEDDAVFIDSDTASKKTGSDSTEREDHSANTPSTASAQSSQTNESTDIDFSGEDHTEIEEDDAVLLGGSADSSETSELTSSASSEPSSNPEPNTVEDSTTSSKTESANSATETDSFDSDAFNGEVPADETQSPSSSDDEGDILTAGEDPVPQSSSTSESNDQTLTCDSCRFSVDAEGTPIRRGDICPHCKEGYIE